MTRRMPVLAAALVTALAACGGGASSGSGGVDQEVFACGGTTFPARDLADMPGLDSLSEEVLAAVDDLGEPVVDPSMDWRVAASAVDEVVLLREVAGGPAAARGDTHEVLELGPAGTGTGIEPGTWFLWSAGSCVLRTGDALGEEAEVRLAAAPSPTDTGLDLLVNERNCASGQDAEGRIELDELTLTDDAVLLRVSVRRADGDQECPANPWTPFRVDLGEPLGAREVLDANLVPPTPLRVGTDEQEFDPAAEPADEAVARAVTFSPWQDYTMLVETTCACDGGTFRVVVRAGEVVARQRLDGAGSGDVDPFLAPSLGELLTRLDELWAADPAHVTDILVAEDGLLARVAFDAELESADDEVGYVLEIDVDSPGDPLPTS